MDGIKISASGMVKEALGGNIFKKDWEVLVDLVKVKS